MSERWKEKILPESPKSALEGLFDKANQLLKNCRGLILEALEEVQEPKKASAKLRLPQMHQYPDLFATELLAEASDEVILKALKNTCLEDLARFVDGKTLYLEHEVADCRAFAYAIKEIFEPAQVDCLKFDHGVNTAQFCQKYALKEGQSIFEYVRESARKQLQRRSSTNLKRDYECC